MDLVVFGDSHSLKFSGRYGLDPACQIRTVYEPSGFNSEAASRFVRALQDDSATLGVEFYIESFRSLGIFGFKSIHGRGRCHTSMDKGIAYAESKPIISPILMLCATDIDFRGVILKNLLGARLSTKHTITEFVLSTYGGLFNLIGILKKNGCNLIIEGLIPPTPSDNLYTLLNGYSGTASLRGKVYLKVDVILERILNHIGCPYISYRKLLASDQGLLIEDYHLDGIHLSSKALPLIIDAIAKNHVQSEQNNFCWQHLGDKRSRHLLDTTRSPEIEMLHNSLADDGIAVFQMSEHEKSVLKRLKECLKFHDDVGNKHTRYDWPGNSRAPYSNAMNAAQFSHQDLLTAKDLFLNGRIKSILSQILGFDFSIYNIRAFMSSVHSESGIGPQDFHHDGTPPYLYRAVIYMSEVEEGDGHFEYIKYSQGDIREGKALDAETLQTCRKVVGAVGTIIIFDANRLLHRGSPPFKNMRYALDLSIGPTPAGSDNFIIAAGMNNWPCDPYCFSVKGLHFAFANDDMTNEKTDRLVFNRYPTLESYFS